MNHDMKLFVLGLLFASSALAPSADASVYIGEIDSSVGGLQSDRLVDDLTGVTGPANYALSGISTISIEFDAGRSNPHISTNLDNRFANNVGDYLDGLRSEAPTDVTDWNMGAEGASQLSGPSTGGTVPEPSFWAMLLVGFGLLGLLVRRTRRGAGQAKSAFS